MKNVLIMMLVAIAVGCSDAPKKGIAPGYGLASGHVEYRSELHGLIALQHVWFDEHGSRQRFEVQFPDQLNASSRVQLQGDSLISMNLEAKTGQCTRFGWNEQMRAFNQVDLAGMSDSLKKVYQVKMLPDSTVLNHSCKVWQLTESDNGAVLKYWTWNNLPLRLEITQGPYHHVVQAVRLDEHWEPTPDWFTLPDSVKIVSSLAL